MPPFGAIYCPQEDAATLGIVGGLPGHLWKAIPQGDLRELGELLEAGDAALVVVAVDKEQDEIDAVITHTDKKTAKKLNKGDIDGALGELAKSEEMLAVVGN